MYWQSRECVNGLYWKGEGSESCNFVALYKKGEVRKADASAAFRTSREGAASAVAY